jgi:hypothetical protein
MHIIAPRFGICNTEKTISHNDQIGQIQLRLHAEKSAAARLFAAADFLF